MYNDKQKQNRKGKMNDWRIRQKADIWWGNSLGSRTLECPKHYMLARKYGLVYQSLNERWFGTRTSLFKRFFSFRTTFFFFAFVCTVLLIILAQCILSILDYFFLLFAAFQQKIPLFVFIVYFISISRLRNSSAILAGKYVKNVWLCLRTWTN